jgi:hypothetical protein
MSWRPRSGKTVFHHKQARRDMKRNKDFASFGLIGECFVAEKVGDRILRSIIIWKMDVRMEKNQIKMDVCMDVVLSDL